MKGEGCTRHNLEITKTKGRKGGTKERTIHILYNNNDDDDDNNNDDDDD